MRWIKAGFVLLIALDLIIIFLNIPVNAFIRLSCYTGYRRAKRNT